MANKYYWHSRISEKKFREIARCFALDMTAAETADKIRLTRKSVNTIFLRIRRRISETCEKQRIFHLTKFRSKKIPFLTEQEFLKLKNVEGKPKIFVIVFRSGIMQSEIIYAVSEKSVKELETQMKMLADHRISQFIFSDFHKLPMGRFTRYNKRDPFKDRKRSLLESSQGTVNFLLFYNHFRLQKFNGITSKNYSLHFKESEWRINNHSKDLYLELLKILRENPI